MKKSSGWVGIICAAAFGGTGSAFLYYCEKLQLLPLTTKGLIGRLGVAALTGMLLYGIIFFLIRKTGNALKGKTLIPVIFIALIASVCAMVWFPVPDTGLYSTHVLTVRTLSDGEYGARPVTLTWLHRDDGDVPLSRMTCTGNCTNDGSSVTLLDENAELTWKGITGNTITVEFVSDEEQGIAGISWDGTTQVRALNNAAMERLSFDFAFPPSDGLPEFIVYWLLCLLLCFAGAAAALILLPGWSVREFGMGAFVCFALFRVIQFSTVSEPLFFIDSESYLGMSKMPVMDIIRGTQYCHEQYWYCISRPAFIPLVYKLCRQDPVTIPIAQLIVSILSWGYFANRTAGLMRTDSRKKAVLLLIFGLGCVPNVTRWDQVIMSESLSISAALLLMGSCFWLVRPGSSRWDPKAVLCTALSSLLYAQSRDSAVWSVLLIAVLLACLNRLRGNRKLVWALCVVLAAISWSLMSNTGGRWQYPFENVLFNRILRNPQGEQFFIQSGMPMPERIDELYGVEHMMGSELFNSEEMRPLREWILSDGLKTYIRWMLRTPFDTLRMAWYAGFETEAFEQIDYIFMPTGFVRLLPDPVVKFFSCNLPGVLIIGLGLAGIWTAFRRDEGERYAFPVLFVLSAYILCSAVLIADEYELARHSMVILIMMKASAWPLICMLSEEGKEMKYGN